MGCAIVSKDFRAGDGGHHHCLFLLVRGENGVQDQRGRASIERIEHRPQMGRHIKWNLSLITSFWMVECLRDLLDSDRIYETSIVPD